MSMDPEVIPSSRSVGFNAVRSIPGWAVYGTIGLFILILVAILKTFFPLIVMGLILGAIWKQSKLN